MRVALTVAALALAGASAAAHGEHADIAASPSSWDAAALAGLFAAGLMYAVGSVRLDARAAHVRRLERAAFWLGWAVLVAAVSPPIDAAAASMFSAHMAQHELLMLVGAPLMIVGRPIVPWLWALPRTARSWGGAGLQSSAMGRSWQILTTPLLACALHAAAIWVWHLPPLYEAAVQDEALHAFQHLTFVATSVCFWWGLVYGRYGRAAYGASALYVFVTSVHTGVLGAMFSLSSAPWYGVYAARAADAGIDAAADQQLAGLYMWIPAGIVLTIFGLALLVAWLAEAERRAV